MYKKKYIVPFLIVLIFTFSFSSFSYADIYMGEYDTGKTKGILYDTGNDRINEKGEKEEEIRVEVTEKKRRVKKQWTDEDGKTHQKFEDVIEHKTLKYWEKVDDHEKDEDRSERRRERDEDSSSLEKEQTTPTPVPPPPPPKPADEFYINPIKGCSDKLTWTEITYERGDEKNYWKPVTRRYEVKFTTDVKISDAKGRDLKKKTMKSGYGFKVNTSTTSAISQISGPSAPHKMALNISLPQSANVTTSWNMRHIYKKQPKTIALISNGSWRYKTPVNPLSKTKSDVIYTDRNMKDGKHPIFVEIKNITVNGHHLCTKNVERIPIKGDMYEDVRF